MVCAFLNELQNIFQVNLNIVNFQVVCVQFGTSCVFCFHFCKG